MSSVWRAIATRSSDTQLVPRYLVDVTTRDQSCTAAGPRVQQPVRHFAHGTRWTLSAQRRPDAGCRGRCREHSLPDVECEYRFD